MPSHTHVHSLIAALVGAGLAITAVVALQTVSADAAPESSESSFVPMTPCRLIDTRPGDDRVGPHGAFGIDDTRTIDAHGTNGECTVPTEAVGLFVNVTATGATQPTFLTVWGDGERPTASSINPVPEAAPTPNGLTTELSSAGSFQVFNRFGTVNVIIDVNGYFTDTALTALLDRVELLEQRTPFVVSSEGGIAQLLVGEFPTVATVTVTAPVDGHVVLDWNAMFGHGGLAGDNVVCIPQRSTDPTPSSWKYVDNPYMQWWTRGDPEFEGSLSGFRPFDVTAESTTTFELRCARKGSDSGNVAIFHSNLTAHFTPSPPPTS